MGEEKKKEGSELMTPEAPKRRKTPKRARKSTKIKNSTIDEKPSKPQLTMEELEMTLESEQKRAEELHTQLVYLQAEHENNIKDIKRQEASRREQAKNNLIQRLLPILDDLERAQLMVPLIEANQIFIEGLKIVVDGFNALLHENGLKIIECEGKPYDPLRHEAVIREETVDHPPNTVIEELRKGYLLKGDLLRPSLVKIAIPPKSKQEKTKQQTKT